MQRYAYPIVAALTIAAVSAVDSGAATSPPVAGGSGRGITRPFARDQKNDLATSSGEALVRAHVAQVLGTRCDSPNGQRGEVPWNTAFGSVLYMLRHVNNGPALEAMARHFIVDAIARWEPRVRVRTVTTQRGSAVGLSDNALVIDIRFDILDAALRNVVARDVQAQVQV